MSDWPSNPPADLLSVPEGREHHTLDAYFEGSELVDVRLDGESVFPTWFKLEFKESGEVSAKVKGLRLASRYGDRISLHHRGQP